MNFKEILAIIFGCGCCCGSQVVSDDVPRAVITPLVSNEVVEQRVESNLLEDASGSDEMPSLDSEDNEGSNDMQSNSHASQNAAAGGGRSNHVLAPFPPETIARLSSMSVTLRTYPMGSEANWRPSGQPNK